MTSLEKQVEHGFAKICTRLDQLDDAIRGNGDGRPGIILRLDRLEGSQARRSRWFWVLFGLVGALAVRAGVAYFMPQ